MESHVVVLGSGGRVVIPARLRRALGVQPGDDLVLTFAAGELRVTTRDHAIARAQETVGRYAGGRGSLVDELLEERRAEAGGD